MSGALGSDLVSVVIAVRDASDTIDDQLGALAGQRGDVQPFEVVVVDDGSRDDTTRRAAAWADHLPLGVVTTSGRRGVSAARNTGVAAARGDRILMCDGDDVVSSGWLGALATALEDHAVVTGPLELATLNVGFKVQWGLTPITTGLRRPHGHLPFAPTGNLGFRREVFDAVGGFALELSRGEDVDFAWRAIAAGAEVGFAPDALVHRRLRPAARRVFAQGWHDGSDEPLLYRRHHATGMQRESWRAVLRAYRGLLAGAPAALAGRGPRHAWAYDVGQRAGRAAGSIRHRRLFP